MKKKLTILSVLISVVIGIYVKNIDKDIYPSECTEIFYVDQIDYSYKFKKLDILLQENLLKKDLKFVCFLGLDYHFPGLDLKTDKLILKKYGSKLICTGDVTDKKHSKFIQTLYNYYANYNQMLLSKLKNRAQHLKKN